MDCLLAFRRFWRPAPLCPFGLRHLLLLLFLVLFVDIATFLLLIVVG
jgi:hypothetical protein